MLMVPLTLEESHSQNRVIKKGETILRESEAPKKEVV
jgi:hypothetical protein